MRKKSKYKPRPVILDTMAYVKEGMTPVRNHESTLINLSLKNHAAMTALTKGAATVQDMDVLFHMINATEALYRLGFGKDFGSLVEDGLNALEAVGERGAETGKFILKSHEMNAINEVMEFHDEEQLNVITVKDMERANEVVLKEFANRRVRIISKKGKS